MSTKRVLLVDDDRDIALGGRIRLEAAGFVVETAFDGEEGLARAMDRAPDVIVLDIRMPKMDGLAMLEQLREHDATREIPVVVLSADGLEKARERALELGAKVYIRKPYDPGGLVAVLHRVMEETEVT